MNYCARPLSILWIRSPQCTGSPDQRRSISPALKMHHAACSLRFLLAPVRGAPPPPLRCLLPSWQCPASEPYRSGQTERGIFHVPGRSTSAGLRGPRVPSLCYATFPPSESFHCLSSPPVQLTFNRFLLISLRLSLPHRPHQSDSIAL